MHAKAVPANKQKVRQRIPVHSYKSIFFFDDPAYHVKKSLHFF